MAATISSRHVQAKFFTKQEIYAVPDTPFSVPAEATQEELNALVNKLLQEGRTDGNWSTVKFEFIVNGEFLRHTLGQHAEELSTESVTEVEYLEKVPTPVPQEYLLHDDWVSAVCGSTRWIATGCYDSSLHLWSIAGEHKLAIPGHTGPVKAVTWLRYGDEVHSLISTSYDQTAMVWEWNPLSNSIECLSVCRGHARSIDCVAGDSSGTKFVTGSWDKMIKVWSSNGDSQDARHDSKRQKMDGHGPTSVGSKNITPIMTLAGHKEAVSAVEWIGQMEICSASWDRTLRIWDIELGGIKTQLIGNKNFLDISFSKLNGLLLSSSCDRHIRLWDPRMAEGSMVQSLFSSHTGWVTSVHWSPTDPHLFISGSHDALLKLWDTRSPSLPLFDMTGHQDKILCCDWTNPDLMLSGGADGHLKLFKTSPLSSTILPQ